MSWDKTVDWVVVGSGAAGMSGALRARDLGLDVLIVEAADTYGGSTAISGGVVWIPNSPQLPSRGIRDSRADAIAYLTHITQGVVEPSRIAAYVDKSVEVLAYLHEHTHLRLDALEHYPDYYAEAPGGKPGGRSMEPLPFDATRLGDAFEHLTRSHPQSQIMGRFGVTVREVKDYLVPDLPSMFRLLGRFLQYFWRGYWRRGLPRDPKLHAGNALIGALRLSLLDRDVPLWRNTPMTDLVVEDGVVTGIVVTHQGAPCRIRATRGVLLAAGGFERNQAMRDAHHHHPSPTTYNAGHARNQGDAVRFGQGAGAAVALMDEAWWTPASLLPKSSKAWLLVVEKSLPGSIFVNAKAQRYTNEAGPYLDVGRDMFAHDAGAKGFMVFDATYRRNYPVGPIAPGYAMPDSQVPGRLKRDWLRKADTLDELAALLELDAAALTSTIAAFNADAAQGHDPAHHRGACLSDRTYSDPRAGDNPCLRPITTPPFYAIPIVPGDLGTKGGLVTDASARVLRPDGHPIPGLYAAGNSSAAVMGRTYPGAGGTIGPALVFGFVAAETAAASTPAVKETA